MDEELNGNSSADLAAISNRARELLKRLSRNELAFLFSSLIVAIVIWLIGDKLDETRVRFLAEPIKSIALFWGSLSFLETGKDFLFKKDYEIDKEKLLDQATQRYYRVMDENKGIHERGIRRVRDNFDIPKLKELIRDLQPGDSLYCHDGSISDFSKLKEAIKSKALTGVRFKFISLAPYCKNAIRRAGEVGDEVDFYSSGCKKFASTIESIIVELKDQSAEEEALEFDPKKMVQLKLYRSLMSIPFYLVLRDGRPVFALTGFYLSKASSSSIHIEWEEDLNRRFRHSQPQSTEISFLGELLDYWTYKWEQGCLEYDRSKCLEGDWEYESFDEADKLAYQGKCTIEEDAGCLKARGIREKTFTDDKNFTGTHILWETNVMHKYNKDDELCLITSHNCYPQGSSIGLTAFMLLTLKEEESATNQDGTKSSPLVLSGSYFVSGETEDNLFRARSGRVVFKQRLGGENRD